MKPILLMFTVLLSINTFAFETKTSGFLGVDLIKAKKVSNVEQKYYSGVGAIDLKIYAYHEDFIGKIKLDLDDGSLDSKANIFEEASITYKFSNKIRFVFGKGKVKFSKQRRGAIEAGYIDGGSLIGTNHAWYDIDNKNLLGLTYGNKDMGFFNHFTIYGSVYEEKVYDLRESRGLANTFEFFPIPNMTSSVGFVYYQDNAKDDGSYNGEERNWAFNTNSQYYLDKSEIFFEYQLGKLKTGPGVQYGANPHTGHLGQIGGEYYYSDFINLLLEFELAIIDKQFNTSSGYKSTKLGSIALQGKHLKQTTAKVECGIKFKMDKKAFFTVGALIERATWKLEGVEKRPINALQLASTYSFWF